jgi:CYTH domain-containing protein
MPSSQAGRSHVEIERKFLVEGEAWRTPDAVLIRQGYLNEDPSRTVRVRTAGANAFLTIKGKSKGATRAEFEYAIPLEDAEALFALCQRPLIEKFRHTIPYAGLSWEVDEFLGENAGLVVAEVELTSEGQCFERPAWAGREVTSEPRYFNSSLARNPFSRWDAEE